MAGKIQVPNNIEDKTVLKRFLTDLVLGINGSTLFSGNVQEQNAALVEILQSNPNVDFINIVSKLTELRTDILTYVEDNIETIILQQQEDIVVIAEQFGTFYEQALAASWYGLTVKAGGAVAGLEVGSLDPNVTTPGDESSYFRVVADNFILGRAYEDLTQAEKDYLAANNLPSFGTVYNAQKQPVPALVTTWDSNAGVYKHYFNGIVQFTNIAGADYANAINNGTTTINGGKITTNTLAANILQPSTNGTTVWSGGGLVSQNFNGSAVGNIGTPTTGFRLSSNAAGTSTDPTIYGAYIKGGTIDGVNLTGTSLSVSDIKIKAEGYPNNFGKVFIKKVMTRFGSNGYTDTITLYSRSYGGGFISDRLCAASPVITIVAQSYGVVSPTGNWSMVASVQISYNGTTWQTVSSSSSVYSSGTVTAINFTPASDFTVLYIRSYHAHTEISSRMSAGSIQLDVINGLN